MTHDTAEIPGGGPPGGGPPGGGPPGASGAEPTQDTGYLAASLAMADIIGAHRLDLREWLLLDFIRRQSFGAGRTEAYVPGLRFFVDATGISKGNVSAGLKWIKQCLVVEEFPQWCYGFLLPVNNWKIPVRLGQVEVIRQLALFEAPAHLSGAMRQVFVEQCKQGKLAELAGTAYAASLPPTPEGARDRGVPENGTPHFFHDRSRIGNESQEPVKSGSSPPVPESGTTCNAMQQCPNVKELRSHKDIATSPVPESGTLRRKLDGEQQRLMDELRSAGAFGRGDCALNCWLGMVRARPAVVEQLLGELRYRRKTYDDVDDPGAWMMDKWKRWGRPNRV